MKQQFAAKHPWTILAAGAAIQVLTGLPAAWGVFQQPVMEEYGLSEQGAGYAFALLIAAFGVGCVLGGFLQDRHGPRCAGLWGTALLCGGSAALIYSGAASRQISNMLISMACYIVMAVSLNLVVGLLGELSLGHAGFMSVGLFTGCLLSIQLAQSVPIGVRMPLSMLLGGVAAAVVGLLVGLPALRLKGDYLAIVTLAFGEIVKNVMNACYLGVDSHGLHFSLKDSASLNLEVDGKVLINGAMGITGIKKASTFTIGIVLVIVTLLVILNLVNSRAGRAIKAIRDNEIAARSVGIPITKYKLMAFVTSAVFAGVAGVLYALNYSSLVAKKFDYNTSILILVFVVLGGIGNLRGSVIAAAVLTVLPELLRSMNDYRMLIYAIVLIVVMIFNQSPEMIALRKRLTARFRKEDAEGKGAKDKEKKGVA